MPEFTSAQLERLANEDVIWLATVRPNNSPHLAPIWYVWLENKAYVCTPSQTIKARNIRANPQVIFALQNGNQPLIIEGTARHLDGIPESVAAAFREKYDWEIRGDETNDAVIEITPNKVIGW